jgi:hypothetical protein
MTIVIIARSPGKDWGVLNVFDEGFRENHFRIAQQWRDHLPADNEVQVVSIPRSDGSKCSETISLKRMKFTLRNTVIG